MAVPSAPSPSISETAISAIPMVVLPVVQVLRFKRCSIVLLLVVYLKGHGHVDDGQHHENVGLQGDDQDVEHGPGPLHDPGQQPQEQPGAEQYRDDEAAQLTGIHVTQPSGPKREWLTA